MLFSETTFSRESSFYNLIEHKKMFLGMGVWGRSLAFKAAHKALAKFHMHNVKESNVTEELYLAFTENFGLWS